MKQLCMCLLTLVALMNLTVLAQTVQGDSTVNATLRQELIKMGEADQQHRGRIVELLKQGQNPQQSPELEDLWKKQREIDEANMKRLEQIVKENGWPGVSLVGAEASRAAFLIVQHAEPIYQEKYLPLLRDAAAKKDIVASELAMLEDRVLMSQNKKQIYGTQLKVNPATKKRELWPIEDEANVDARRASVGLMPLAGYLKMFGIDYVSPAKN